MVYMVKKEKVRSVCVVYDDVLFGKTKGGK